MIAMVAAIASTVIVGIAVPGSMGCALPVAALQATQERLAADLAERNRLLFMAERVAGVGHWHLDLASERVTWSSEVFRIHGLDDAAPLTLDLALDAYHRDDRERLVGLIAEALRTGEGFHHRARIVRPTGEIRHIDVKAEVTMAGTVATSLFGVIQDVSEVAEAEHRLTAQREAALAAASNARKLAETDPLTGLANRRRILDVLASSQEVVGASGAPLSIAVFDIDHFKRVNDTYGHPVGDAVLRRVAGSANRAVRSTDVVGRLGGEEFVALLPGTGMREAAEIAERLRRCIEAHGGGGSADPRVTISVGVATLQGGEDAEALMRRADRALYRAKAEGRNLLRLAS